MATLNKTKKDTQIILTWIGILIAIISLIFMIIKFYGLIKNILTPPAAPEASFGKLPAIPFPDKAKENLTYSLDTVSGSLPSFSDRTKVYKIILDPPTLLGLDKTRKILSRVGFYTPGTQISENTYQWTDQNLSMQKTITMNLFSSDFTLSSSYLATQSSLQNFSNTDEKDQTIQTAKDFLSSMSLFQQDIDESKTKITPYSITNGALALTSKISDIKIVKVDFIQKDINNLPIYYDKGISSTISFLVGKENNVLKVVNGSYFHKNISEISSAYAIKTASEAYLELQGGKAYIAYKPTNTTSITIKEVFLGYYIGENQQEYLMPIVIFKGNDNFIAYVSAIRDEWISN
jgi:hypothetical protein